jgi:membrane protease YdiL (CAAX protease family)
MSAQESLIVALAFAAVAVLVIAVDAVLLIVWLWHRDAVRDGLRPPVFARQWSLVDPWVGGQAAIALLVWLLIVGMIAAAVAGMGSMGGDMEAMQTWLMAGGLIVQNVLLVATPYAYIRYRYGLSLPDVGFSLLPTRRQVALGLIGGVALLLLGAGLELGITAAAERALPAGAWQTIERLTESLSVETMFPDFRRSWGQFAALFIGAAIAAPVGEEFFFRAFLHNCAKRRLGVFWGTALSATVFAVVHGGPLQVIAIVPVGVVLAWAYDRTGSLWVPIIIHAVNNGVGVIAMRVLPEGWV